MKGSEGRIDSMIRFHAIDTASNCSEAEEAITSSPAALGASTVYKEEVDDNGFIGKMAILAFVVSATLLDISSTGDLAGSFKRLLGFVLFGGSFFALHWIASAYFQRFPAKVARMEAHIRNLHELSLTDADFVKRYEKEVRSLKAEIKGAMFTMMAQLEVNASCADDEGWHAWFALIDAYETYAEELPPATEILTGEREAAGNQIWKRMSAVAGKLLEITAALKRGDLAAMTPYRRGAQTVGSVYGSQLEEKLRDIEAARRPLQENPRSRFEEPPVTKDETTDQAAELEASSEEEQASQEARRRT